MTKQEWKELGVEEDEKYLIRAIRTHLLSPVQRQALFDRDLNIDDLLTGNFGEKDESFVQTTLKEWNKTLGWREFGF
jgi:hypothetical protein